MDSDPPSKSIQTGVQGTTEADTSRSRLRFFYGWWIVAAATTASAIQSAVFNVGAQALVLPLERDLAATRTAITGAFSLSRLEGGVTGPIEGYLIHWIGPRRYMMGGWVFFGAGFMLLSMASNLYQFYGSFLLITLGQSIAGFLPIVTVLINWFFRWRGRVIAIYQLGGSIGALLVPVWAWSIQDVGWRSSCMIVGIVTIIIGVPLAAMMRNNPEEHGYLPDGERPSTTASDAPAVAAASNEDTVTISQALRGGNFWFLALSHSAGITAWGALRVHQIPAIVDIGMSEITAASILSYTLIVGRSGAVDRRVPGRQVGTAKDCRRGLHPAGCGSGDTDVLDHVYPRGGVCHGVRTVLWNAGHAHDGP